MIRSFWFWVQIGLSLVQTQTQRVLLQIYTEKLN